MKSNYYFPHDYHARHDPKLERLRMTMGCEGLGIYWCLIEMLYEENGSLPLKNLGIYAKSLNTTDENISKVLNEFDLFCKNKTRFYSISLKKRLKEITVRREKARVSAESRWNANAMRTQCERNAIKERKVKESKVKESKVKESKVNTLVELFNSTCVSFPQVQSISTKREKKISLRLKEHPDLEWWEKVFEKMQSSDFLKGEGKSGWRASFNWLIENEDNCLKIIEGNYDKQKYIGEKQWLLEREAKRKEQENEQK